MVNLAVDVPGVHVPECNAGCWGGFHYLLPPGWLSGELGSQGAN